MSGMAVTAADSFEEAMEAAGTELEIAFHPGDRNHIHSVHSWFGTIKYGIYADKW